MFASKHSCEGNETHRSRCCMTFTSATVCFVNRSSGSHCSPPAPKACSSWPLTESLRGIGTVVPFCGCACAGVSGSVLSWPGFSRPEIEPSEDTEMTEGRLSMKHACTPFQNSRKLAVGEVVGGGREGGVNKLRYACTGSRGGSQWRLASRL